MQNQGKKEIINWGRELYLRHLASGSSGNISMKLSADSLLITAHDAYLGFLSESDVVLTDSRGMPVEKDAASSTETPLHVNIYKEIDTACVIHSHPPYTNAFFANFRRLEMFTFEVRLYLGDIPVIPQETPAVTDIKPVIEALKRSNIVILKNHGVAAIASNLRQAFAYIDYVEELSKTNLAFKGGKDFSLKEAKDEPNVNTKKYKMFSKEHVEEIVRLVNADPDIRAKGRELSMTTNMAVKLDETGEIFNLHFKDGVVENITYDEIGAEFIISGSGQYWRMIFNRQLDPFAATTQKKLKLKGDFARISRWYAPCSKIFEVWKQVPVD